MSARFYLPLVLLVGCLRPAAADAQVGQTDPTLQVIQTRGTRRDAASLSLTADAAADGIGRRNTDPQIYSGLRANLTYSSIPQTFSWQFNASTAVRKYGTVDELLVVGHNVGGSMGFSLGARTRVGLSQHFGYVPAYSLAFTPSAIVTNPGQLSTSALDFSVTTRPAYYSGTSLDITRNISRRSSLSLGAALQRTDFVNDVDPSMRDWTAQVRFTHELSKYSGFHVGWARRDGRYSLVSGSGRAQIDDIDVGIHYRRPLPISRNTTISFGTGSTIAGDTQLRRNFTINATANLVHTFARTGRAQLVYQRGVRLLQGFVRPVYADSGAVLVSLGLSDRLNVNVSSGYTNGTIDRFGQNNSYRNITGSGQLIYVAAQRVQMHVAYLYYQHDIGDSVNLLPGIPYQHNRQTVRVGMTLTLPIVRQRIR